MWFESNWLHQIVWYMFIDKLYVFKQDILPFIRTAKRYTYWIHIYMYNICNIYNIPGIWLFHKMKILMLPWYCVYIMEWFWSFNLHPILQQYRWKGGCYLLLYSCVTIYETKETNQWNKLSFQSLCNFE